MTALGYKIRKFSVDLIALQARVRASDIGGASSSDFSSDLTRMSSALLSLQSAGAVVVDSMLIITPIVGFCYCSMF